MLNSHRSLEKQIDTNLMHHLKKMGCNQATIKNYFEDFRRVPRRKSTNSH